MASKTVALSNLPFESRESILFALASELDSNALHFALLPDADNPHRDPALPVVAVTWKVSKTHPVLNKLAGAGIDYQQHPHHPSATTTAGGVASATVTPRNSRVDRRGASPLGSAGAPQQRGGGASSGSRDRRRRASSASSSRGDACGGSPAVVEQILTVSPVIRGSPTVFRRPSPVPRSAGRAGGGGGISSSRRRASSSAHHANAPPQVRSAQWAQRHVDDFLHFAAKSGVDTVQHTSVSFALQCYMQYQSGVASSVRAEFTDLVAALDAYFLVCPACRLLHWLLGECDDFSGVAALSYLASTRFNDQIVSARQVVSLSSRVETVAGHCMLINRKYVRVNDTVAILRLATKRWNMHAAAHAKKEMLHFLRSHRDVDNAVAFDYIRHVDLYAVLLQLGKSYVATNAGRSGPSPSSLSQVAEDAEQQQQQQRDAMNASSGGSEDQHHHHPDHRPEDPNPPVHYSADRHHQHHHMKQKMMEAHKDPNAQAVVAAAAAMEEEEQQQQPHATNNSEAAASPSTMLSAQEVVNTAEEIAQSQHRGGGGGGVYSSHAQHQSPHVSPARNNNNIPVGAAPVNSYAQKFEQRQQHQQQQRIEPNYPPRSSSWAKRIDNAQATLQEVMRRFDGPLSSPSSNRHQRGSSLRGSVSPNYNNSPSRANNSSSSAVTQKMMFEQQQQRQLSMQQSAMISPSRRSLEENKYAYVPAGSRQQQQQQRHTVDPSSSPSSPNPPQQHHMTRRSTSQEPTTTIIGGGGGASAAPSTSMPRPRSTEPQHPIPAPAAAVHSRDDEANSNDNMLDPDSALFAEQVKQALERNSHSRGGNRGGSESAQRGYHQQQQQPSRSQLEMIATAVSPQ